MTIIDQKRLLKLAGLLKEEMQEWIDESHSKREEMEAVYSDMYKELNGIRPRWVNFSELTDEELQNMIDDLQKDIDVSIEDERWEEERSEERAEEEKEIEELEPSAEEQEQERLPMRMGMGRLEEVIRSLVQEALLEKTKKYKGKSMRLGGGGRFAKFVDSLKKSGKSEEQARAIAYKAGVKKYGKAKMTKMAAAGKKRKAKKKD